MEFIHTDKRREIQPGYLVDNDLGDRVGVIWESVRTSGKKLQPCPWIGMGEVGNLHGASHA